MNDLISRFALLSDIKESIVFSQRSGETSTEMRGAHKVTDRIKAAPAVDAVAVVRCKDCKHFMGYQDEYKRIVGAAGDCRLRTIRCNEEDFVRCKSTDFCSRGERRTE